MRRRHLIDLASASLILGALAPASRVLAECAAPTEERAQWLTTTVRAGGPLYVWLGQPRGLPMPAELELSGVGQGMRLGITWIVPGLARVTMPSAARGTVRVIAPARSRGASSESFDVAITQGPGPGRIAPAPTSLRVERVFVPTRWSQGETIRVAFEAPPSSIRHVLARWGREGSFETIAAGATSAVVFQDQRCGTRPVDADAPSAGARVEVSFIDDEGNLSATTDAVVPA